MNNNHVYKKLKIALALTEQDCGEVFRAGGLEPSRSQLNGWQCGEGHKNYRAIRDHELEAFLDGLIATERED